MKKILLVTRPLCEPWDEASKNFAYDLARTLTGHELHILTHGMLTDLPASVVAHPIYTHKDKSFWQDLRLLWYVWRHAKEYDVVHLLFTPTPHNTRIFRKLIPQHVRVVQTVATVRDDLYTPEQIEKMLFGARITVYSDYGMQKLGAFGITTARTIAPGINLTKFTPSPRDEELASSWGLTPEHCVVTYPGEFVRLGATDLIVDAFIELWSDPAYAHVRYLCACRIKNPADLAKKTEIIERLKRAGHLDKVIFTDTFGDMNAVFNLSDMVIFPVTTMRGKFDVPLAMIEPYACKKPVICSDLDVFAEFSDPAMNVIIPTGDTAALTQAVRTLATDVAQRDALGAAAYDFIHKKFDIATIAKHYTTLYEEL